MYKFLLNVHDPPVLDLASQVYEQSMHYEGKETIQAQDIFFCAEVITELGHKFFTECNKYVWLIPKKTKQHRYRHSCIFRRELFPHI